VRQPLSASDGEPIALTTVGQVVHESASGKVDVVTLLLNNNDGGAHDVFLTIGQSQTELRIRVPNNGIVEVPKILIVDGKSLSARTDEDDMVAMTGIVVREPAA
jgi:hypothetical protein